MKKSFLITGSVLVLLLVGLQLESEGFVRIRNSSGTLAAWRSSEFPLELAINPNSSGVDPTMTENAIRNGLAEWESSGAPIRFTESMDPIQRASSEWNDTGFSLVMFDPNDISGLFGAGPTGVIAVTPILIAGNGRILDADIVYNARDFTFSVDASPGTMDIENIGTHELGHFLGLDHTSLIAATMFPFAEFRETLRRTITSDECHGMVAAYGAASSQPTGSLTGRVVRMDTTGVSGAMVVLVDGNGAAVTSALTGADGAFEFHELAPGDYSFYADPLDGPVDASNLLVDSGTIDIDFSMTYLGSNASPMFLTVTAGTSLAAMDLIVEPQLASFDADLTSPRVLQVFPGRSDTIDVEGNDTASATPHTLASGVQVSGVQQSPTVLRVTVTVAQGTPSGLYDLYVEDGGTGRYSALSGVIEVGPGPEVDSVFPAAGSTAGGTLVTIKGRNFEPGVSVMLAGVPVMGVNVVDSETIQFTTPAAMPGMVSLALDQVNGGRFDVASGFTYVVANDPTLGAVAPQIGSPVGMEMVTITGTGFQSGAAVQFGVDPATGLGGTVATQVMVLGTTTITAVTPTSATLGIAAVLVENPDGTAVTGSLFSYSQVVASGTTFEGQVSEVGQADLLMMNVLEGTQLDLSLAAGKGEALEPKLVIEDSMGQMLLSSDPNDVMAFDPAFVSSKNGKVRVKKYVAPFLDSLALRISGLNSTTGAYALKVKAKLEKEDRGVKLSNNPATTLDMGNPVVFVFEALDGTEMSGKLKFDKDAGLVLTITLDGPTGMQTLMPGVTPGLSSSDKQLAFSDFILPDFGTYTLTVSTAAGVSQVKGGLKFREPRVKQTLRE